MKGQIGNRQCDQYTSHGEPCQVMHGTHLVQALAKNDAILDSTVGSLWRHRWRDGNVS